jgi:murein DD-endopeptidase MepM/ murein hydrolase activator NlpD
LALAAAGLLLVVSPRVADAGPRAPGAHQRAERVHVVKPGDTLTEIAGRHGVTLAALVSANKLPNAQVRIRPGQRLVIRRAGPPRRSPARAAPVLRIPYNLVLSVPDFDGRLLPFEWPIEGTLISQFGRRRSGWHRGLDIKAEMGMPVLAAAAGIVVASEFERRYGNVVKIQHENEFMTVYAHHLQNFVGVGDAVYRGQVIGQVGRTGRASGYHLHFEIRYASSVYNPLYLLPAPPRMTEVVDTEEEANDDE